ncbi:TAT-variant-translocated molybdopterin oxidoreductase [Candidatus Sumerlaeota bacterium]|nr:TAT-variant-translocated molybdopterin oxidoreductase [Candidatus Sumerlaeota bacterium]
MTTEHNHSHDHVHDDAPDAAMTAPPLYWSTLSELDQDGEYRARVGEEFYPEAKPERFFEVAGDEEKIVSPFSRRTFLKFSAFSALVAAVSGCERPVQKVLPYVAKPEEINYGVANFYASTCRECAAACGLLVKTREGRPIKLEGNPDHPMNRGALCARGQAGVLNLYNPDRLKSPVRAQRKGNLVEASTNGFAKMAEFDKEIGAAIAGTRGRVVLLTPTISGPSNERLIKDFLSVTTNAQHVMYDALETGEERELYNTVFSKPVTPRYRFQNANVVLNLGGDPLGQHVSQSEIQRDWAAKRAPNAEGGMSRVYTFEPVPTLSGINSDYRHAVRPADLFRAGLVIAALVYKQLKASSAANAVVKNADTEKLLGGVDAESLAQETGIALKEYERVAKSLVDAPTRSIVYTKGAAADTADAKNLHLLGILMNAMLGNYQNTIDTIVTTSKQSLGSTAAMQQLVSDMNSGAVEVLIFHGVNPAYTLPKSVGFAQALAKVKLVVSLNLMMDESASLADIAIPAVHGLESWGDAEAQTGVYSMQQPAINPIFGETSADPTFATRAWQESLMAFMVAAGSPVFRRVPSKADIQRLMEDQGTTDTLKLDPKSLQPYNITWYDYIRETWRDQIYARTPFASPTFEAFWTTLVQTGVLDTVGAQSRNGALAAPNINPALMGSIGAPAKSEGLTFVAQPSVVHGDGSSMVNPFLLELPDSVSKVCWDNYASIAPSLAKQLDVEDGEYVNVTVG